MSSFFLDLNVYVYFIIIYFLGLVIISAALLLAQSITRFQHWRWNSTRGWNFKLFILFSVISILILHLLLLMQFLHRTTGKTPLITEFKLLTLSFRVDYLNLNFLTLVCFLFPAVILIADFNFSPQHYRFFFFLLCLEFVIYLFLLTSDLLAFYLLYEFMIGLVFLVLFATSNSRGSIEAALFFLGWAIFGSILVGAAVIYILMTTQLTNLHAILKFNFTPDEIYFLNFAFFAGFGSKLSIWPIWYWLPRAHVEVSAAFSIFLSCILIKVCLYGYIRCVWLLQNNIIVIPFIFMLLICVLDVTCRLMIQVDLKAIIAYGSVLHVNLLLMLILIEGPRLTPGLVLYIWGHSYATAGLFYATNLIEKCYSSRSTFEISGIYSSNSAVALIAIFALITFLEFPLSFFFWGEFWLWTSLLSSIPATIAIVMFISSVVYMIVFFRLWWGVIFGAPSWLASQPQSTLTRQDLFLAVYLIGLQYVWGIQPNILCALLPALLRSLSTEPSSRVIYDVFLCSAREVKNLIPNDMKKLLCVEDLAYFESIFYSVPSVYFLVLNTVYYLILAY